MPDTAAPPIGAAVWGDTTIEWPAFGETGTRRAYRDAFTGTTIEAVDGAVRAAQVFERFPVALLTT